MSLTDKEKIDYEIKARRKDKEENLSSWCTAIIAVIIFIIAAFLILVFFISLFNTL